MQPEAAYGRCTFRYEPAQRRVELFLAEIERLGEVDTRMLSIHLNIPMSSVQRYVKHLADTGAIEVVRKQRVPHTRAGVVPVYRRARGA